MKERALTATKSCFFRTAGDSYPFTEASDNEEDRILRRKCGLRVKVSLMGAYVFDAEFILRGGDD